MTGQSIIKETWMVVGCRFRESPTKTRRGGGIHRGSLSVSFLNRWKEANFIHSGPFCFHRYLACVATRVTRGANREINAIVASQGEGGEGFYSSARACNYVSVKFYSWRSFPRHPARYPRSKNREKKGVVVEGVVVALRVSIPRLLNIGPVYNNTPGERVCDHDLKG